MKELLQSKCQAGGVDILQMELLELSFSHQIASMMLQMQYAKAKMDARKLIVEAGVSIVRDSVQRLKKEGIYLTKDTQSKLSKSF